MRSSSGQRLWDGEPLCRGPSILGGHSISLLRFDNLCDGQWASMVKLSPRLPIRKQIIGPKNLTIFDNFEQFKEFHERFNNNKTILT